ncbi:MAG: aldehyde dehydrogenase family protein, partial [Planctomycetota bacterium]
MSVAEAPSVADAHVVAVPSVVQDFLSRPKKLLINNEWVESESGASFAVYNPADDSEIARCPSGNKADIDKAVMAARRAFDDGPWTKMKESDRGRMIWKLAELLEENAEEFAALDALDNGKPFAVASAADVPLAIDIFRYMAGWCTKIEGNTISLNVPYAPDAQFHAYTLREPVGVVGQITPWNFPLLMVAWKLAPALAAGCCVVLKPAEQTPLSALRLGELIVEAGFPAGVVNIVTGMGEDAGAPLAAHDLV